MQALAIESYSLYKSAISDVPHRLRCNAAQKWEPAQGTPANGKAGAHDERYCAARVRDRWFTILRRLILIVCQMGANGQVKK
jgi:hypothetical protein